MAAPTSNYVAILSVSGAEIIRTEMFYELWDKLMQQVAHVIADRAAFTIDIVCETTHYDDPIRITQQHCATIIIPRRYE